MVAAVVSVDTHSDALLVSTMKYRKIYTISLKNAVLLTYQTLKMAIYLGGHVTRFKNSDGNWCFWKV